MEEMLSNLMSLPFNQAVIEASKLPKSAKIELVDFTQLTAPAFIDYILEILAW